MNVHLTWATFVFVICFFKNAHGVKGFTRYETKCGQNSTEITIPCEPDHEKLACLTISNYSLDFDNLLNKECLCKEGTVPFPDKDDPNDCVVPSKMISTYDGACSATQKCARGLICTDGKCKCFKGYSWSTKAKYCKRAPTVVVPCVPDSTPDTCYNQPIRNLACDKQRKVCDCPETTDYASEFGACKLNARKNCRFVLDTNQEVTEHDVCASHHCGTDNKCDCEEAENIGRMVWSQQDNRCIKNVFEINCEGDGDCADSNSNSQGRTGLTCNKKASPPRCECPSGLIFYQGYCVKGTALHNEKCDPTGKGTACKTDGGTLLTCKQSGGDWKCACLVKDVSAFTGNNERSAIMLTWDSDRKVCDLGRDGQPCKFDYECKSGHCVKNKCGAEGGGRGRRSRGSLQQFHVIPMAVVSIILKVVV